VSRHANKTRRRRSPDRDKTYRGVPVFDGVLVSVEQGINVLTGERDDRVLLGIGADGAKPRAYVILCPIDGVRDVVDDLQTCGALAAEHHVPH
jgi:hypothetical protein